MKRNLLVLFSIVLLGGLMGFGFYQLFEYRFRSGDIFPAYSSFRADPKGTKILFQSLEEYQGVDASRLIKPLKDEMPMGETVLFLGCNHQSILENYDEILDPYLTAGGHVVLSLAPVKARFKKTIKPTYEHHVETNESSEDQGDPQETGEPVEKDVEEDNEHDPDTCYFCRNRAIEKRWQVSFQYLTRDELGEEEPETVARSVVAGLAPVPWQSALYFEDVGDEWTVLYEMLGNPVVIERKWGRGSVVLMADSYLFSNEAIVKDRYTTELIRMIGSPKRILFDELHLGVESQEGIMMLVNRYRLTGVLFALLLLTALYIWKQSSGLIPNYTNPNDTGNQVGLAVASGQGFTHLLMRHIPQKELIQTMMTEWKSTFDRQVSMQKKISKADAELQRIQTADEKLHPVKLYNRLVQLLNERK